MMTETILEVMAEKLMERGLGFSVFNANHLHPLTPTSIIPTREANAFRTHIRIVQSMLALGHWLVTITKTLWPIPSSIKDGSLPHSLALLSSRGIQITRMGRLLQQPWPALAHRQYPAF